MSKNGFDSKDNYNPTQVSGLKTSELENFYLRKVVDLFESFPLTTYLPNYDIRAKRYGQTTKTVHRGAKNLVFSTIAGKIPAAVRIWAETPNCSKKKSCFFLYPHFWAAARNFLRCSAKTR